MKQVTVYYSFTRGGQRTSRVVAVYDQPVKDVLVAKLYHWYDMRFPLRVPGFRKYLKDHLYTQDWANEWMMNQDLRCYALGEKNKILLARAEISDEAYEEYERKLCNR